MKKKIVTGCCLISLAAVIVMFAAGLWAVYSVSEKSIKNNLKSDAAVYADLFGSDYSAAERVKDFGENRVTVLDAEGNVLFESDRSDHSSMDNHLQREEVASALAGSPRIVRRYSETFGCDMYYYALTAGGDTPYVIRLAVRASDLGGYVAHSLPFAAVALLLALALSYALSHALARPVNRQMSLLRDGLRALNDGGYVPAVPAEKDTENFALLSEMNDLFDKISENVRTAQEERAKLDYVLNRVRQGIAAVDGEERIVLLNRAATDMFCRAAVGENLVFLLDEKALYDRVHALVSAGRSEVFEWRSRGRDLVVDVAAAEKDSALSGAVAAVVLFSDVTEEKSALRQRSEFFANASHELKTPLTSIQGLSELLLAKGGENKSLERIYTESKRLNSIVLDMLYISDLESRTAPREERVDLNKLAAEIAAEYRAEAEQKGVTFSVSGRGAVRADARNMHELLGNLMGNAVHYNKQGGKVSVNIKQEGGGVAFSVTDTGIGVAEEHIPHLTERFYRVDKSRSKKTGGTGLGLSIVKHVVALYGGEMEIKSEPGKGTSVRVFLPVGEEKN